MASILKTEAASPLLCLKPYYTHKLQVPSTGLQTSHPIYLYWNYLYSQFILTFQIYSIQRECNEEKILWCRNQEELIVFIFASQVSEVQIKHCHTVNILGEITNFLCDSILPR